MTITDEQLVAIATARATFHPSRRAFSQGAENALHSIVPVLDHGFVRLVDYMGNDDAIAQAASVSYGKGTKSVSDTTSLIRYLLSHGHTTPFEMCEAKFHFKMPMFIGEQTLRHRTANVNKESGRYSVMSDDKYVPDLERIAKQSTTNKQGSGTAFSAMQALDVVNKILIVHKDIQEAYDSFVSGDVDLSRELARGILPANQYAEFYWKIDLHNLMHFMRLRLDHHAQFEIRCYAQAIAEIVRWWVPAAYQAFLDYKQNAVTLSAMEIRVLRDHLDSYFSQTGMIHSPLVQHLESLGCSTRERTEFIQKMTQQD